MLAYCCLHTMLLCNLADTSILSPVHFTTPLLYLHLATARTCNSLSRTHPPTSTSARNLKLFCLDPQFLISYLWISHFHSLMTYIPTKVHTVYGIVQFYDIARYHDTSCHVTGGQSGESGVEVWMIYIFLLRTMTSNMLHHLHVTRRWTVAWKIYWNSQTTHRKGNGGQFWSMASSAWLAKQPSALMIFSVPGDESLDLFQATFHPRWVMVRIVRIRVRVKVSVNSMRVRLRVSVNRVRVRVGSCHQPKLWWDNVVTAS